MSLTELTDGELAALANDIEKEQARRAAEAAVTAAIDAALAEYAHTAGLAREDGGAWVQPTGVHDAYRSGAVVTHGGKSWVSLVTANVWEPGVSGWRELPDEGGEPVEWVRPSGAHDAYQAGDRVIFEGDVYVSVIDGNVWSPTDHPQGWALETE